jgi:hypothetical protein
MALDPYAPPGGSPPAAVRAHLAVWPLVALALLFALASASFFHVLPLVWDGFRDTGAQVLAWGQVGGWLGGGIIALVGARRALVGAALAAAVVISMTVAGAAGGASVGVVLFAGALGQASLLVLSANAVARRRAHLVVIGISLASTVARFALPAVENTFDDAPDVAKLSSGLAIAAVVISVVVVRAPVRETAGLPTPWPAALRRLAGALSILIPLWMVSELSFNPLTDKIRVAMPPSPLVSVSHGDMSEGLAAAMTRAELPDRLVTLSAQLGSIIVLVAALGVLAVRADNVRPRSLIAVGAGLLGAAAVCSGFPGSGSLAWPLALVAIIAAGKSLATPVVLARLYAGLPSRPAGVAVVALAACEFAATTSARLAPSGPALTMASLAAVVVAGALVHGVPWRALFRTMQRTPTRPA